jgi:hypothetical protein
MANQKRTTVARLACVARLADLNLESAERFMTNYLRGRKDRRTYSALSILGEIKYARERLAYAESLTAGSGVSK